MNVGDYYDEKIICDQNAYEKELSNFTPDIRAKIERCAAHIVAHGARRKGTLPTLHFLTYSSYNMAETRDQTYDAVLRKLDRCAEVIHTRFEDGGSHRHVHVVCNFPKRPFFKSLSQTNISLKAIPITDPGQVLNVFNYLRKEDRCDTSWFRTNYAF